MKLEILLIITMLLGVFITLISIFLLKKDKDNYNKDIDNGLKNIQDITNECIEDIKDINNKVNHNASDIFEKLDEKYSEFLVLYDLISKKQEQIEKFNIEDKPEFVGMNSNLQEKNEVILEISKEEQSDSVVFEPSNKKPLNISSVDIAIDDEVNLNNNTFTTSNNTNTNNIQNNDVNRSNTVTNEQKPQSRKTIDVLNLSKQGLTANEIAKELNIGKGEVQLILGLRGE